MEPAALNITMSIPLLDAANRNRNYQLSERYDNFLTCIGLARGARCEGGSHDCLVYVKTSEIALHRVDGPKRAESTGEETVR